MLTFLHRGDVHIWQHQAIAWININLPPMRSSDITTIDTKISLKIIYLKFHPNLAEANELIAPKFSCFNPLFISHASCWSCYPRSPALIYVNISTTSSNTCQHYSRHSTEPPHKLPSSHVTSGHSCTLALASNRLGKLVSGYLTWKILHQRVLYTLHSWYIAA